MNPIAHQKQGQSDLLYWSKSLKNIQK